MGLLFSIKKVLFALFVFTSLFISSTCFASIQAGVEWLKLQQRADGAFSADGSLATEHQATHAALLALHQLASLDATIAQPASEFLSEHQSDYLEDMANSFRLGSVYPNYFSVSSESLAEYQASSGGYGDYPGYESSITSTAILLHAAVGQPNQSFDAAGEAIAYLLQKQRADRGWAEESNHSSIYVTALVSRALQSHRLSFNLSSTISSATEYLLTSQGAGGGWHSTLDAAMALLAIVPATSDPQSYKEALEKLTAAQLPNGSWDNDVFTTSLALQVLYLARNTPVSEVPVMGSIKGSFVSGTTGRTVPSVQVVLVGSESRTLNADESGKFLATELQSGTYTLTYIAPGFQGADQVVNVAANGRVDLGVISLNALPNRALIAGQVTDSETGSPLAGVMVQISGSQNAETYTNQAGRYSLELDAGDLTLTILHAGYHPVSGQLSASEDEHFEFSPALQKLEAIPEVGVRLKGVVVDAQSGSPLPGANVRVASSTITTVSNVDGSFDVSGLSEGAISVEISLDGYQSVNFVGTALANSIINLGVVRLFSEPTERVTLYGRIIDVDTGTSLQNALIRLGDLAAMSDADGNYELQNIQDQEFTISVSADGYQSSNLQVQTVGGGRVLLDIPLEKVRLSKVQLKQVGLDRSSYGAYEEVSLSGIAHNQGDASETIFIHAEVMNPSGVIIDEFAVSREQAADVYEVPIEVNQEHGFSASWYTQFYAPGQYKIILSLYESSSLKLLDQQQLAFEVRPTQAVSSFRLRTTIEKANQGSTQDFSVVASLRNQSNVPINLSVEYDLSNPDGYEVLRSEEAIDILPFQVFSSFNLGSHTQTFDSVGAYKLRILNLSPLQPGFVQAEEINVVPDVRIEIDQALAPSVITPKASERVRVQIRLEGIEVQQ